jgi:hypothetical protein
MVKDTFMWGALAVALAGGVAAGCGGIAEAEGPRGDVRDELPKDEARTSRAEETFGERLDGAWRGTTTQGQALTFEIAQGEVSRIGIVWEAPGCRWTETITLPRPAAIGGPTVAFEIDAGAGAGRGPMVIELAFPSEVVAGGSIKPKAAPENPSPCEQEVSFLAVKEGAEGAGEHE